VVVVVVVVAVLQYERLVEACQEEERGGGGGKGTSRATSAPWQVAVDETVFGFAMGSVCSRSSTDCFWREHDVTAAKKSRRKKEGRQSPRVAAAPFVWFLAAVLPARAVKLLLCPAAARVLPLTSTVAACPRLPFSRFHLFAATDEASSQQVDNLPPDASGYLQRRDSHAARAAAAWACSQAAGLGALRVPSAPRNAKTSGPAAW